MIYRGPGAASKNYHCEKLWPIIIIKWGVPQLLHLDLIQAEPFVFPTQSNLVHERANNTAQSDTPIIFESAIIELWVYVSIVFPGVWWMFPSLFRYWLGHNRWQISHVKFGSIVKQEQSRATTFDGMRVSNPDSLKWESCRTVYVFDLGKSYKVPNFRLTREIHTSWVGHNLE